MKMSKSARWGCSVFMATLMSHAPAVAAMEAQAISGSMISTHTVVADMTRAQAEQKVRDYLSRDEVRSMMLKQGVSSEEATARLASLSEAELRQLAGQIEEARYGGDILVTVLLVVLIIFLVQRI